MVKWVGVFGQQNIPSLSSIVKTGESHDVYYDSKNECNNVN